MRKVTDVVSGKFMLDDQTAEDEKVYICTLIPGTQRIDECVARLSVQELRDLADGCEMMLQRFDGEPDAQ